jgi:3-hydroxyacyl-CoA dehydrogenase
VLGAGVMGAQIAAHCANANVPVVLFDLPAKEGDPNGIVKKALDGLKKLEPTPFATKDRVAYIDAANYDRASSSCAAATSSSRPSPRRWNGSTTSTRRSRPSSPSTPSSPATPPACRSTRWPRRCRQALRSRFCGIHFFNPPRYMQLVEIIPCKASAAPMLDALETFLTTTLGKGVVRALDTPNFVANRVGVFSMLAVMHHTERLGLGFDVVDALTGPSIGRPKSATYRTADVVGLDTLAHVIGTMQATLPEDPWHKFYAAPAWLTFLIGKGALGQKTRAGIYRKEGKAIHVIDLAKQDYRPSAGEVDAEVAAILKIRNPAEKFEKLRTHQSAQAQFLWAIFRDIFHYCAFHLASIADNARDVDFAMRWGFGWKEGPFETWQAAGWQAIANAVKADIEAGKAMSAAPLPAWVFEKAQTGRACAKGSYSASAKAEQPRSTLPVYARQVFPERVLGEAEERGTTVFESEGVRMWTAPGDAEVAVLSFKSKANTLGPDVLEGIIEAVARAERDYRGLVIWQAKPPFSAGANLAALAPALQAKDFAGLEKGVARFQQMSQTLKYAQVPVVAAVNGMALGGGCEVVMHASRAVAALESYIGLVEAGVGLIPAGGGCKEFAVRASDAAARISGGDIFLFLQPVFQTVAMANVSKSALEARELGFLRESDPVVFNAHEILHVARQTARALAESGWRPKLPPRGIKVAGRNGIATLEMMLVNMKEGGMISAHDYRVAKGAAAALCGGDVETGTLVNEDWLLAVERHEFVELLKTEKTQQRIAHMLETGKPLRN